MNAVLLTIQPYGDDDWVALGNNDVYNVWINEQLLTRTKGFDVLTFDMPLDNVKQKYIKSERIVRINSGRQYRIRTIERDKANQRIMHVECESLWYDLNNGALSNHIGTIQQNIEDTVNEILLDTDWSFGESDITEVHSYTLNDPVTPLYKLRYVQKIFNAEMTFDTINKKVNMYTKAGEQTNIVISYDSNIDSILRIDDTTKLTTRIYMYGNDGMTIGPINGGIDYLEDYTWYDQEQIPREIKTHTINDERFTVMQNMYDYMQQYLERYSSPLITYELGQTIISRELNIGDSLRVQDRQLGQDEEHRIAEKRVNIVFPEESVYTLDFAQDDLSSDYDDDYFDSTMSTRTFTTNTNDKMQTAKADTELLNKIIDLESRVKALEGD